MNENQDLLQYDDSDAIKFILEYLKSNEITGISDDDIQYILDIICEYYEKCNILSENTSEVVNIKEYDILKYLNNVIKKEKVITLDEKTLQAILDGEYEYGLSIGIYEY